MSDYVSPQYCVIDACDGGAVSGRKQVVTNYFDIFQKAHIPILGSWYRASHINIKQTSTMQLGSDLYYCTS